MDAECHIKQAPRASHKIIHWELSGNDLKDMKWEWCKEFAEKHGGEILS